MKISVFSIVFNIIDTLPEGMFELNIKNMYDHVDEIIIVEGATRSTTKFDGDTSQFTKDGRSTDGTIELLNKLEQKYPKVKVIIGEGFWDGKTRMCNAAATLSTGDYLWQLDSDEFYKQEDILSIKKILEEEQPDSIHFYANHFWGGWNTCIDERDGQSWGNSIPWKRIFRHKPGASYWISHEPPVYICDKKNLDNGKIITRDEMLQKGIKMYHYSYVQESQVIFKSNFFRNNQYIPFWNNYKNDKNTLIFGDKVSDFIGEHPEIIKKHYNV